jgi:hypothetical protein
VADYKDRTDEELRAGREELLARLAVAGGMTPGSFQEEWTRCGKGACHCAEDGDAGHGPYRSVLRYQAGRTVKRAVPAALVDEFRGRVGRWGEFERACGELADIEWELSLRELGRARRGVGAEGGAGVPAAKKRGSATRIGRNSRPS